MKKTYFLSALLWCLLALAACGKEIKETEDESRYFEIRGEEIGQLGETESGQFLLGQQYYHGEPVSLIAVPSESGETTGALDVYLCSMEGIRSFSWAVSPANTAAGAGIWTKKNAALS